MIYFSFNIGWLPVKWKLLCGNEFSLSKNKMFEWQINRRPWLIGLSFDWHIRQSHAGIGFDFTLFAHEIMLGIRDKRHWDYEKGTWEVYDEKSV